MADEDAVQRTHEPPFLELAEPSGRVQRHESDFRVDEACAARANRELGPAEPSRGAQSLEAIYDLQGASCVEHQQCVELSVPLKRAAHGLHGGGLFEPQRTVTTAGTADRVLGTYPDPAKVATSPTAKALHGMV